MSSKYTFEWIGDHQWRLTSSRGMVWEARLNYDNCSCIDTGVGCIVQTEAVLLKGANNPIPTNGLELVQFHTKRSVVNGMRRLMQVLLYNRR